MAERSLGLCPTRQESFGPFVLLTTRVSLAERCCPCFKCQRHWCPGKASASVSSSGSTTFTEMGGHYKRMANKMWKTNTVLLGWLWPQILRWLPVQENSFFLGCVVLKELEPSCRWCPAFFCFSPKLEPEGSSEGPHRAEVGLTEAGARREVPRPHAMPHGCLTGSGRGSPSLLRIGALTQQDSPQADVYLCEHYRGLECPRL